MKATHTPGPWTWRQFGKQWVLTGDHSDIPFVLRVGEAGKAKGMLAVRVGDFMEPLSPEHPDARLIAAAPEMHEALEKLAANVDGMLSAFNLSLREAMGNTNVAVLAHWTEIARAALVRVKGEQQ